MFTGPTGPTAGPSSTVTKVKDDLGAGPAKAQSSAAAAPVGQGQVGIAKSKKVGKQSSASRKARLKSELGKEKALEKKAVLEERVKGREERKVSPKTSRVLEFHESLSPSDFPSEFEPTRARHILAARFWSYPSTRTFALDLGLDLDLDLSLCLSWIKDAGGREKKTWSCGLML